MSCEFICSVCHLRLHGLQFRRVVCIDCHSICHLEESAVQLPVLESGNRGKYRVVLVPVKLMMKSNLVVLTLGNFCN